MRVSYADNGADSVEDSVTRCYDAALSSSCHNANVSSPSYGESRRRLTRSTSDKSPRCTAKHHRSTTDHDRPAPATPHQTAGATQWPAAGERSTLPRASRNVVERSAGDVWRPMNDVDVPVKDFIFQHQQTTSVERAGHKTVTCADRALQRKCSTRSPTVDNNDSLDNQTGVWTDYLSSPSETIYPFITQPSGRQTAVQTVAGGSKEQVNNYGKLDYCNSLTQPFQTAGPLSRSWFDIDRPRAASPMSSSAIALSCLRQSSSTDAAEKPGGGTITETKTVCTICSSEAFITEKQVKNGVDQSQTGALRDCGYRGVGGGSLPRCYGQRAAGELGVAGSAGSMPRGMSLLSAGSVAMPSAVTASSAPASSSSSSSELTAVLLTTAAAGSDVRMTSCPSPKRSLSSRDDECKQAFCSRVCSTNTANLEPPCSGQWGAKLDCDTNNTDLDCLKIFVIFQHFCVNK